MRSLEQATANALDRVRLVSIKSKIIAFAVVATVIPSVTMGWMSYRNNLRVIDEKIEVSLSGKSSQVARELRLWVKERRHETRVLAGSYEVSENVEKLLRPGARDAASARARLTDYLQRVNDKFPDYESLIVLDLASNQLAASRTIEAASAMPDGWNDTLRDGEPVIGEPAPGVDASTRVVTLVEPIRSASAALIGAMASRVDLAAIDRVLREQDTSGERTVYVTGAGGEVLASSTGLIRDGEAPVSLAPASVGSVLGAPGHVVRYRSFTGSDAIGMSHRLGDIGWFVVAERGYAPAYAGVHELRDRTLQLIGVVAFVVGLLSYVLGMTIVRPLDRLIAGARRVARGDFDVEIPVQGRSEISYLTSVFNRMTASLRVSYAASTATQEALRERNSELLEEALTDPLTGLFNRKSFSRILDREVAAARRHRRPVSVLMIDVDRFKQFNDVHGHLAGDEALRAVADCIRDTARGCDYAMRYGGEEFLVLTENDAEGAERLGERLRVQVAALEFERGARITISVGVATFGVHAHHDEELVEQADAALYASKAAGRDRVMVAEPRSMPDVPPTDRDAIEGVTTEPG